MALAEPPDPVGLACVVSSQRVSTGMILEVQFSNQGDAEISLGPGPHLVWYRDAAATVPMPYTARATRVQNAPIVVPAHGGRVAALFSIGARAVEELRCNPSAPAASALYFYQFSQRPGFRCLLQGYDVAAIERKTDCGPGLFPIPGAAGK